MPKGIDGILGKGKVKGRRLGKRIKTQISGGIRRKRGKKRRKRKKIEGEMRTISRRRMRLRTATVNGWS